MNKFVSFVFRHKAAIDMDLQRSYLRYLPAAEKLAVAVLLPPNKSRDTLRRLRGLDPQQEYIPQFTKFYRHTYVTVIFGCL
jgi:hypothetical protein